MFKKCIRRIMPVFAGLIISGGMTISCLYMLSYLMAWKKIVPEKCLGGIVAACLGAATFTGCIVAARLAAQNKLLCSLTCSMIEILIIWGAGITWYASDISSAFLLKICMLVLCGGCAGMIAAMQKPRVTF